jgi:uncharacterized protein (UPF0303 family)
MAAREDIAKIIEQEKALGFSAFDEETAFALGTLTREMAIADGLSVIVDVRLWDRPLCYSALPGTAAANFDWARRKINSVQAYHKSTYRMFLEQGASERIFPPDYGLDPADYAIAGGAFPIRVAKAGVIGAVAVSGLPQRDDHNLVVRALCLYLRQDEAGLALPAQD